jgi:hypothetical protein
MKKTLGQSGVMCGSTPCRAVDEFTAALHAKDLDTCVGLKGFTIEAREIAQNRRKKYPGETLPEDFELQVARTLETAFRKRIRKEGFPYLEGVAWATAVAHELADDRVIVSQQFYWPDGTTTEEKLLVVRTESGWRLILPQGDRDRPRFS